MKRIKILLFLFFGVGFLFLPLQAQTAEDTGVRIPLENYIKGQATGDPEYIRKAFHPDAKLFFNRQGKFSQLTVAEFVSRFTGKPAEDEAKRIRRIDSVNVSGDAAIAKITLDYPAVIFTDYMSLLKIDGEWKIVSKAFYAEPKPDKK